MTNIELMNLINKERELAGELHKVRLAITNELPENTSDIYTTSGGAYFTKTATHVKVTHTDGFAYQFRRPDVAREKAAAAEMGRKGRKYKTVEESIAARREQNTRANARRREKKLAK